MKNAFALIAISLVLTLGSFAQPSKQSKPERLSHSQLLTLIATAKTPTQHEQLARYYDEKAQDYLNQSAEHQQMAEGYRKNPLISSSKWATGTISHCEFIAKSLKEDAGRMQALAQSHREMAVAAAHQ
jgi:hypothetical protein